MVNRIQPNMMVSTSAINPPIRRPALRQNRAPGVEPPHSRIRALQNGLHAFTNKLQGVDVSERGFHAFKANRSVWSRMPRETRARALGEIYRKVPEAPMSRAQRKWMESKF